MKDKNHNGEKNGLLYHFLLHSLKNRYSEDFALNLSYFLFQREKLSEVVFNLSLF